MSKEIERGESQSVREKSKSVKQRIIRRLFEIFYEVNKERNIGYLYSSFLMIISFLQMCSYIYSPPFHFEDSISSSIADILSYLRIFPSVQSSHASSTNYFILLYAFSLLIIFYFLQLLIFSYFIPTRKLYFSFPRQEKLFLNLVSSFLGLLLFLLWKLCLIFGYVTVISISCSNNSGILRQYVDQRLNQMDFNNPIYYGQLSLHEGIFHQFTLLSRANISHIRQLRLCIFLGLHKFAII